VKTKFVVVSAHFTLYNLNIVDVNVSGKRCEMLYVGVLLLKNVSVVGHQD
jgi:hypothetical protein